MINRIWEKHSHAIVVIVALLGAAAGLAVGELLKAWVA